MGQIFGIKSPNNVILKQEAGERTVGEMEREWRDGGEEKIKLGKCREGAMWPCGLHFTAQR